MNKQNANVKYEEIYLVYYNKQTRDTKLIDKYTSIETNELKVLIAGWRKRFMKEGIPANEFSVYSVSPDNYKKCYSCIQKYYLTK